MWFGTDGHGLTRYDGQYFTHFTAEHGIQDNFIWTMLEDSKGNLWLGLHDYGIVLYDGKRFTHYTSEEGLIDNRIRSLLEDDQGNLWIGTLEGASRFDGDTFTNYHFGDDPNSPDVYAMTEDSQGNIWFGSWGGGLSRFTPLEKGDTGGVFTHYSTGDGLNNSWVLGIIEDRHHSGISELSRKPATSPHTQLPDFPLRRYRLVGAGKVEMQLPAGRAGSGLESTQSRK